MLHGVIELDSIPRRCPSHAFYPWEFLRGKAVWKFINMLRRWQMLNIGAPLFWIVVLSFYSSRGSRCIDTTHSIPLCLADCAFQLIHQQHTADLVVEVICLAICNCFHYFTSGRFFYVSFLQENLSGSETTLLTRTIWNGFTGLCSAFILPINFTIIYMAFICSSKIASCRWHYQFSISV